MPVAALYDIHGNLPALEAVLREVGETDADQIVVGGDIFPGPMPRETLQRLLDIDLPVHFIHGNGELAMLAQMAATDTNPVMYWGTTSGAAPPESIREVYRWTAKQIPLEYEAILTSWPKTLRLTIDGIGDALFCHSTPRSETEVFTRLTSEDKLLPIFEPLNVALLLCGHTHMQFDRMIGTTRVVNAGSVGEPFGEPGAFWALLGPDVQLRRTDFDLAQAAARVRATEYPQAEDFAVQSILHPPAEAEILELFGTAELK